MNRRPPHHHAGVIVGKHPRRGALRTERSDALATSRSPKLLVFRAGDAVAQTPAHIGVGMLGPEYRGDVVELGGRPDGDRR